MDWRQRFAGCSNEGRDLLATQANLSALLCVFSGRHKKKMCANFLWLYSYFTETSLSKNKNINYIFIYLQVLCCLSSGSICDTSAQTGFNTRSEFNRVFLLLNWSALLCTHSWRENSWIHTFPKGINAIWNANSLVQVLTTIMVICCYLKKE